MKILYVLFNDGIGGGNKIIYEHAQIMVNLGHSVNITFMKEEGISNWFGLKSIGFVSINKVMDIYDVIVATYYETAFHAIQMCPKAKHIYFVQSKEDEFNPENKVWCSRAKSTYQMPFDAFLVESKYLVDWLKKIQGINKPIYYVPNALHTDKFNPDVEPYFEKENKFRILVEGNPYFWLKGIPDAFNVLTRIKKEFDVEIWYLSACENEIDCDIRIISPPQDVIPSIYKSCDMLLKCSYLEGSPLPHIESIACAVPVITTDHCGVDEYCIDGVNSLIVPVGDIDAIYKAVKKLIMDKGLYNKLVEGCKNTLPALDWSNYDLMLENVFKKVINER